jgi:hypothetical protein
LLLLLLIGLLAAGGWWYTQQRFLAAEREGAHRVQEAKRGPPSWKIRSGLAGGAEPVAVPQFIAGGEDRAIGFAAGTTGRPL